MRPGRAANDRDGQRRGGLIATICSVPGRVEGGQAVPRWNELRCVLVLAVVMGSCSAREPIRRDTLMELGGLRALGADSALKPEPHPEPHPETPAPAPPAARAAARAQLSDTLTAATAAELAMLRGQIMVPVLGVRPQDLRDSYAERRGNGLRAHEALDIMAPRGTSVLSATDGRVLKLHSSVAGGLMIYAADASGHFIFMYGHLDAYAPGLAEGQPLRRGAVIATVGSTGNASANAPHLHFAILRGDPSHRWWRGRPVNPYPLLSR